MPIRQFRLIYLQTLVQHLMPRFISAATFRSTFQLCQSLSGKISARLTTGSPAMVYISILRPLSGKMLTSRPMTSSTFIAEDITNVMAWRPDGWNAGFWKHKASQPGTTGFHLMRSLLFLIFTAGRPHSYRDYLTKIVLLCHACQLIPNTRDTHPECCYASKPSSIFNQTQIYELSI